MRFFPLIVVAGLLCCLTPQSVWAQHLRCSPCNYGFGKVQIGTSLSFSFELTNTGTKTLSISSKAITGSGFSYGNFPLPMKLNPGASVQLPVIFTPAGKGYSMGTLTLKSNDPNSPLTMKVHGVGFYPAIASLGLTPASFNFGSVTVETSASTQVTLTASGGPVTISSDQSNSSEFAILGLNLPVTLAAGQSIAVTLQFTPNASGKATGKVGFISNAVDSPTIEQLTGTGIAQQAHNVSLSWEPGDQDAVGYNIYRSGSKSGPFTEINSALDSSTNYTDYTVSAGKTYYYVTTEVNNQGQESGYSNEVQAVIPNQ
jgi:Protein of unknown function (DUF1573)/Abnormal spindle-like microcephaly-assoc'd, ASPM-SPD-2-Hydin